MTSASGVASGLDYVSCRFSGSRPSTLRMPSLRSQRSGSDDVLNGIAYDAARKRLFVTGKLWPRLFEIQLTKGR